MERSAEQPEKAYLPMVFTPLGMTIDSKLGEGTRIRLTMPFVEVSLDEEDEDDQDPDCR